MTDKTIGRTTNDSDGALVNAGVIVNATTSTVIAAANPNRITFHVNNNAAVRACWVKLQAASVDNDLKGIFLAQSNKGNSRWEMPTDNIYTGEISAMADSGTETIYVTEY